MSMTFNRRMVWLQTIVSLMTLAVNNLTDSGGDSSDLSLNGGELFEEALAVSASFDLLIFVQEKICSAVVIVINIFGICGSLMIFVVLFKKTYAKHQNFRLLLSSASLADLSFNVLSIPATLLSVYQEKTITNALIDTYFICRVVTEVMSLFSDQMAILLMFTRYISLLNPVYWYSKSKQWKRRFFLMCTASSCLLCSMKIPYACQIRATLNEANNTESLNYAFLQFLATELTVWNVISLLVLPFVSFSVMLYLILRTVALLRRRAQIQAAIINDQLTNTNDNQIALAPVTAPADIVKTDAQDRRLQEHRNTTSLVMIDGASLILCQTFSIFLSVAVFVYHEQVQSAVEDKEHRRERTFSVMTHLYVAVIFSTIFQCITRSYQFYCYILFNATFRSEFCKTYRSFVSFLRP